MQQKSKFNYNLNCKHCNSNIYSKDGFVFGKQRYKCRKCHKTFRDGDDRPSYKLETKLEIIEKYNKGIREREQLYGASLSIIVKWKRKYKNEKNLCTNIKD